MNSTNTSHPEVTCKQASLLLHEFFPISDYTKGSGGPTYVVPGRPSRKHGFIPCFVSVMSQRGDVFHYWVYLKQLDRFQHLSSEKPAAFSHSRHKIWPEPLNTFLNSHVPQPSGNAPEGQGAAPTFSLDSGETKESKSRSFLNERLSCLIHLELYKTRAAIIYAYRDIDLFLIVSGFKI